MNVLDELYALADKKGYDIDEKSLPRSKTFSIQLDDGSCAIALDRDYIVDCKDEVSKLGHEIGHCETGSFYNADSPADERGRHEERANRWAFRRLVPPAVLGQLLADNRDIEEISEYFGVPESFVRNAYNYYMVAGIELTAEESVAVEELAQYELIELPVPSETPPQPPQEATPAPSVPEPTPQQRKPAAPRWGFVRRGYLILWDEVQPGDIICKPPRDQPKDDPHCPRILAPVPKRPRARRCEVDIWK